MLKWVDCAHLTYRKTELKWIEHLLEFPGGLEFAEHFLPLSKEGSERREFRDQPMFLIHPTDVSLSLVDLKFQLRSCPGV